MVASTVLGVVVQSTDTDMGNCNGSINSPRRCSPVCRTVMVASTVLGVVVQSPW